MTKQGTKTLEIWKHHGCVVGQHLMMTICCLSLRLHPLQTMPIDAESVDS